MKNPGLEEKLLASMAQRGLEAPLEGVEVRETHVLLNGFKRYRCARKLHIQTVPYVSLGSDWNRAQGGGGAIDLVMHLHQLSFCQAVQWLAESFPGPFRPQPQPPPRRSKVPQVSALTDEGP